MTIRNVIRCTVAALATLCARGAAWAQSPNVVIASAYGGGGFNAGTPLNDYVDLFNRSNAPVDLTGWSLQVYYSSTWNVIPLSGTIAPGGYYLVAVGTPSGATGDPLPPADATANPLLNTSALASPNGLVAVCNTITPFGTPCPLSDPTLVDLMTFGTSNSCFEGSDNAPGGDSGSLMTFRKSGGCQDTNDNANDFELSWPPNPRSTSSPTNTGGVEFAFIANPRPVNAGASTTLTAYFQGCNSVTPAFTSVTADLSAFGLSATQSLTGGPTAWTYVLNVPALQATGDYTINFTATFGMTTYPGSGTLRVLGAPPSNDSCAGAFNLNSVSLPSSQSGLNVTATDDSYDVSCNTDSLSAVKFGLWYTYQAAAPGRFVVTETAGQDAVWTLFISPSCPAPNSAGVLCSVTDTAQFVDVAAGDRVYALVGQQGASGTTPSLPLSLTFSFAPQATNDECATAQVVTLGTTYDINNLSSPADPIGLDPGECNVGTLPELPHAVWFVYTPASNGVIKAVETSTQGIASGVWEVDTIGGTCPSSGPATYCSNNETFHFNVQTGKTYYILVHTDSTTAPTTSLSITFTLVTPPGNDVCSGATVITVPSGPTIFDNTNAGPDLIDIGTCNTAALAQATNGIWLRYDHTGAASNLRMIETSSQNIAVGIWEMDTVSAACPTAGPTTYCSNAETGILPVQNGKTYYMLVHTDSQALSAVPISASFDLFTGLPGDDCSTATVLTSDAFGTPFAIDNSLGTDDSIALDPGDCNTASLGALTRGVWFKFDCTFEGALKADEASSQGVAWGIWEMNTVAAACPTSGPATYCTSNEEIQIQVHTNKTYYFLVHTDSATVSATALSVTFTQLFPPSYDACSGAITVSHGTTFTGVTTDCTSDPMDTGTCNLAALGAMTNGIWFRYDHPAMAPNQSLRLAETSSHGIASGVWVMPTASASCPSAGPATICNANETFDIQVTADNTYYILVHTDSQTPSTVALAMTFTLVSPPTNDDCANAETVVLGMTYPVNNLAAIADPLDTGDCNLSSLVEMNAGVWFRYDSTFTGVVRAAETSSQNIASGVWEMDTAGATCPSSGPATWCAASDTFHFNVLPAKTYYILVHSDTTAVPTTPMSITFSSVSPPSNDQCASAQMVTLGTIYTVDNTTAGDDPIDIGTCNTTALVVASSGVWFRYDCLESGTLNINETSTQGIATGIWEMDTVTAACPTPGTPTSVCNDTEAFNIPVMNGKTYYFLVQNDSTTAASVSLSISFELIPIVGNDDCASATIIPSFPAQFTVDNRGAAADALDIGACNATANAPFGVWFRYDSTTSGVVLVEEFSSQNVIVGTWTTPTSGATCPSAGPATTCGPSNTGSPQRFGFSISPGNTYFILVHLNSTTLTPTVPVDVKFSLLPSVGENCANAQTITGKGAFTLHNLGAVIPIAPFTSINCPTSATTINNDAWYRWVAPASGNASLVTRTFPTAVGSRFAIYNALAGGACPTATSSLIRCAASGTSIPDNGTTFPTWTVVAGNTYYIQMSSSTANTTGFADVELLLDSDPVGRCCLGTTSCLLTSSTDCTTRGGTYGGNGTACVPSNGNTSAYVGGSITMTENASYTNGTISVADTFTIEDVEVEVDINHLAQGDVRLALMKGSQLVTLAHRGRRGYTPAGTAAHDLVGTYTFNDSGSTTIFDAANNATTPIPSGVYRPAGAGNVSNGLRDTFHGQSAAGVWTLVAADEGTTATGGGTVNSWTLRLKQGGTSACAPANDFCCRGTTCNPVTAGTCTGIVAGSQSIVRASCGSGNAFASCCYADYNHDSIQSIDDLFLYFNAYFTSNPMADFGGTGTSQPTIDDLFLYINAYFGTCS